MGVFVKVCGLKRPEDARQAMQLGAAFGGVIGYAGSPRFVSLAEVGDLLAEIPEGKRVWVGVEPEVDELEAAFRSGFDFVQVHFDPDGSFIPEEVLASLGRDRVWLAPRLADPMGFRSEWAGLGSVSLIDGFSPEKMGGTGKRVNGSSFAELTKSLPDQIFSLAGGISPENVEEALKSSGAIQIDVNSGIETLPGVKDHSRMEALFQAVHRFESESGR